MKDVNVILNDKRIIKIIRNTQKENIVQLKLEVHSKNNEKPACVKFSRVLGWEHLSVSYDDEIPSWDFMQEMKEMFWEDEEVCFQLHPKKSEYINNCETCLHIWRNIDNEIITPPTILIGFREGNETEDRQLLKEMQEELGYPLNDCEIDLLMLSNIKDEQKIQEELKKLHKKYTEEQIFQASLKMLF